MLIALAPLAASDKGKAGPLGLLVILLLAIATVFLVRSMLKHLRKVPESFDERTPPPPNGAPRQE